MIRAIIFDCFGVLTTDGWLPFKAKYFGHDPALFDQAGALNSQTNIGVVSYTDFLTAISEMSAKSPGEVDREISNNVPNAELFAYIKQLNASYKIGMLSNASDDWMSDLFEPSQTALFDVIALSYEMKFTKPMAEAYATVAERLNVEVDECVFIDDQERYITGAQEAGMQAIWYKDFAQLKAELSQLLADTKN